MLRGFAGPRVLPKGVLALSHTQKGVARKPNPPILPAQQGADATVPSESDAGELPPKRQKQKRATARDSRLSAPSRAGMPSFMRGHGMGM